MDLSFQQVNYDGDLSDFDANELRELVRRFEEAQESNVAEFEKAAEVTTEIDSDVISDFKQARDELISEITEADEFDDVPLSEDALEDCDFTELQEWSDFVIGRESVGEEEEKTGDDAEFDDFGTKSPDFDSDDEVEAMAKETLSDIPGVTTDD